MYSAFSSAIPSLSSFSARGAAFVFFAVIFIQVFGCRCSSVRRRNVSSFSTTANMTKSKDKGKQAGGKGEGSERGCRETFSTAPYAFARSTSAATSVKSMNKYVETWKLRAIYRRRRRVFRFGHGTSENELQLSSTAIVPSNSKEAYLRLKIHVFAIGFLRWSPGITDYRVSSEELLSSERYAMTDILGGLRECHDCDKDMNERKIMLTALN